MATRRVTVEDEPEDTEMGMSLDEVPMDRDYNIRTTTSTSGTGQQTEKASHVLAQLERKRFAQTIAVPTDDKKVRATLRQLGEPITLFGEGPAERRDRLRELLTQRAEEDVEMGEAPSGGSVGDGEEDEEQEEEYYTEGVPELVDARREMARFSMERARGRIAFQKKEVGIPLRAHVKFRKQVKETLAGFDLYGSQVAADRPLGSIRFAPHTTTIATGTWSGTIHLLNLHTLDTQLSLRGHSDVVSGLAWMPPSLHPSPSEANLVSGGGEGDINLWSLEQDTPLATLSGHTSRVARVDIHPSGRYVASASHDMTWRLWDLATTTELQLQEGHSREVHAIGFNGDGSLLASGGMDSVARVWDIRTGRMAMFLDAHVQPVHALDWGGDGYRVLTGSMDGYVKCWDLRMIKETASIGAHSGGVNDLRWFRGNDGYSPSTSAASPGNLEPPRDERGDFTPKKSGTFIVSVGFDKMVKIWSADDWALVRTMSGHSSNITGVDVTGDGAWIGSCGRDRTVKLWAREDGAGI